MIKELAGHTLERGLSSTTLGRLQKFQSRIPLVIKELQTKLRVSKVGLEIGNVKFESIKGRFDIRTRHNDLYLGFNRIRDRRRGCVDSVSSGSR
jgi:hypothetical protein